MENPVSAATKTGFLKLLLLNGAIMILPLPYKFATCEPFTDYLNITTPKGNGELIHSIIQPILNVLGASEVQEGLFSLPEGAGTFRIRSRGRVDVLSASGGFLSVLRAHGFYGDYLVSFAEFEHRISMLHATVDYRVDAPPAVEAVYELGKTGTLHLTRKAVLPEHVSRLTGPAADGRDTGTVYLGNRKNSDVWAKVYDKGHEALSKRGKDIGQLLRVEIAVQSDVGATLRDASVPHDIFYHFASRSLVEPPASFKCWEPHGKGFFLEHPRSDFTPIQQLKSILDNSPDISRLIRLAKSSFGDEGLNELQRLFRNRFQLGSI